MTARAEPAAWSAVDRACEMTPDPDAARHAAWAMIDSMEPCTFYQFKPVMFGARHPVWGGLDGDRGRIRQAIAALSGLRIKAKINRCSGLYGVLDADVWRPDGCVKVVPMMIGLAARMGHRFTRSRRDVERGIGKLPDDWTAALHYDVPGHAPYVVVKVAGPPWCGRKNERVFADKHRGWCIGNDAASFGVFEELQDVIYYRWEMRAQDKARSRREYRRLTEATP